MRLPKVARRILLSRWLYLIAPTATTWYFNRTAVSAPPRVDLPDEEWARRESYAALDRSLERFANLEAKGPGLATVAAVIIAAIMVALDGSWGQATALGRAVLGISVAYSAVALVAPLLSVGPIERYVLDGVLSDAASREDADAWLATRALEFARKNSFEAIKFGNLLDAARRDLIIAVFALAMWILLGPLTGIALKREPPQLGQPTPARENGP